MSAERRWDGPSPWRRVVLKLSGEALADPGSDSVSADMVRRLAEVGQNQHAQSGILRLLDSVGVDGLISRCPGPGVTDMVLSSSTSSTTFIDVDKVVKSRHSKVTILVQKG